MSESASMRPPPAKALVALTILAAAALYLLGNGRVSLWDRDEPRYAQCSRQMLRGFPGPGGHGPDLIVPRYLTELRTEKPPFIYWCQAAAMKVFGENAFAARFPSAVAMTLVLIGLAIIVYRGVGPMAAVWTVFIMASSALTIMSAKMALTDAMLLLWTGTAQVCIYAVYRGNRSWKITLLLWAAIGMALLTKGPIVLAGLGAAMVVLAVFDFLQHRSAVGSETPVKIGSRSHAEHSEGSKSLGSQARSFGVPQDDISPDKTPSRLKHAIGWWAALRPLPGLVIAVAIVGPWLWLVHHREPAFLPMIFSTVKRHLASGTEKHSGPPGYYLAVIWGLFFPWCLLLPTTVVIAWRNRDRPIVRYCLAIVIGVWVFQEIMVTKLPFYVLPIFPALALLTAETLLRALRREIDDLHRANFMVPVAIFATAVLAMGGAPWLLTLRRFQLESLVPVGATAMLSVAAAAYAAVVIWLFGRRNVGGAAVAMGVGVMLIFALMFGAYLPNARYLQTSPRVAETLREHEVAAGDAIMIQYKEPSLAFYQGGSIRQEHADHFLERTSPENWPTWVVMPKGLWETTRPDVRSRFAVVGDPVRGLDYAGKIDGKRVVDVMVLRKTGK